MLIFWILLFYYILKWNIFDILSGVGVGSLIVFSVAALIEYNWGKLTGISLTDFQSKVIVCPIIEELSKILIMLLSYQILEKYIQHLIAYGTSIGLGFAFIENFGHVISPFIIFFRNIFANYLHMLSSYVLSYSVHYVNKKRYFEFILFIIIAFCIHMLYNYYMFINKLI